MNMKIVVIHTAMLMNIVISIKMMTLWAYGPTTRTKIISAIV